MPCTYVQLPYSRTIVSAADLLSSERPFSNEASHAHEQTKVGQSAEKIAASTLGPVKGEMGQRGHADA